MTVRQLFDQRDLPLVLRAGEAGLDGEVLWAHATDLPEPWPYLSHKEALLTNGTGMTADPAAQTRFVSHLKSVGGSALGYGLDTGPGLTPSAIREANRVGLPLFTLPKQAKFSDVAQLVAATNAEHQHRELQTVGRLYEILHNAVTAHVETADMLRELEEELRAEFSLVNLVDGSAASGSPDRGFGPDVVRAAATVESVPTDLIRLFRAGEDRRSALLVPLDIDIPVALVVSAPDPHLPSRALLHHVATAVTIALTRTSLTTPRGHSGPALFADLAAKGNRSRAACEQLRKQGIEIGRCVVIAARRVDFSSTGQSRYVPHGGWEGLRHVAVSNLRECHVLLDLNAARNLPSSLGAAGWTVGVSGQVGHLRRVRLAIEEARWTVAVAHVTGRSVVQSDDPDDWMYPASRALAEEVAYRTIGPLVELDGQRGSDYVNTLRAWLTHDRSWDQSAQALNIHKQTLGYRLRKIEEVLGVTLHRTDHLAVLWSGVNAHDLVAEADWWMGSLVNLDPVDVDVSSRPSLRR